MYRRSQNTVSNATTTKEMDIESILGIAIRLLLLIPSGLACLEQVHAIVRDLFQSLVAAPSSLLPAAVGKGTLKRFGLDLLVDEQLRVWLIEVNVLKGRCYGIGMVKGKKIDMERAMALEMVQAEDDLKRTLKQHASADVAQKPAFDGSVDAQSVHTSYTKLI